MKQSGLPCFVYPQEEYPKHRLVYFHKDDNAKSRNPYPEVLLLGLRPFPYRNGLHVVAHE